jgi:hypothetical protein
MRRRVHGVAAVFALSLVAGRARAEPSDEQIAACFDAAGTAEAEAKRGAADRAAESYRACAEADCPAEVREECRRGLATVTKQTAIKRNEPTATTSNAPEEKRSNLRYLGPAALGVAGFAATTWGIGSFIAWSVKKSNLSPGTPGGFTEYQEHDKKITKLGAWWATASIGGVVMMTVSLAWLFAVTRPPKTIAVVPQVDPIRATVGGDLVIAF